MPTLSLQVGSAGDDAQFAFSPAGAKTGGNTVAQGVLTSQQYAGVYRFTGITAGSLLGATISSATFAFHGAGGGDTAVTVHALALTGAAPAMPADVTAFNSASKTTAFTSLVWDDSGATTHSVDVTSVIQELASSDPTVIAITMVNSHATGVSELGNAVAYDAVPANAATLTITYSHTTSVNASLTATGTLSAATAATHLVSAALAATGALAFQKTVAISRTFTATGALSLSTAATHLVNASLTATGHVIATAAHLAWRPASILLSVLSATGKIRTTVTPAAEGEVHISVTPADTGTIRISVKNG